MAERHRHLVAILGAVACLGFAATAVSAPSPRLVWNASASAPIGLYRALPGAPVRTGDLVIARLPAPLRLLAAQRRYLPLGVPVVKRVVATGGDRVCARDNAIAVNATPLVHRLERDAHGRPLPRWSGCRTLQPGEVLLVMSSVRDSFDGRYFGPTAQADIVARAEPLWVW